MGAYLPLLDNAGGGGETTIIDTAQTIFTTLVDVTADPNVTYIGKARPGTMESAMAWQIRRVTQNGPDLKVEFANLGVYDQAWTSRTFLTYS